MSSPKKRKKARRRAERTMDEAFEALLQEQLPLAEKLARRAIDGSEMNPRLWLDLGRILHACGRRDDAEEAARRAIALAPTHAEAFLLLATLQAEVGKWAQAERLQRRAVELRPDDVSASERLSTYAAMLPAAPALQAADDDEEPPAFTARTGRFDWTRVAADLPRQGAVRLPRLLSADECAALRALWDRDCFEHRVVVDDEARGRVEYRFLQRPLPPLVQELRQEVYARLAPVADALMQQLGRAARFPPRLERFLERCAEAGQFRTTPILLRYPRGGHNAPHRDVAGKVVFPFQLAVTLGPSAGRDAGGAFRLVDRGHGRRAREHRVDTDPGDGVLFCTQERLVAIADVVAAQPVDHGVAECTVERFALGVPFHEHG